MVRPEILLTFETDWIREICKRIMGKKVFIADFWLNQLQVKKYLFLKDPGLTITGYYEKANIKNEDLTTYKVYKSSVPHIPYDEIFRFDDNLEFHKLCWAIDCVRFFPIRKYVKTIDEIIDRIELYLNYE